MTEQKRSTDLNKPELTGRRRYYSINPYGHGHPVYRDNDDERVLKLQVEESVFTEVSGVTGWEIRWRDATPADVTETVIGLPNKKR